jgi:hypothetical protein
MSALVLQEASVSTCFVIQPFDSGKYDKRFDDVYKPAIEAAGLEAYRVDRDHSVDVPIDAIEEGIRNAAVCLADITVDNPNVWYELGYAFARGRPVVMVCSTERPKFPFDIQHRSIVRYLSESPRDFDSLKESIIERIKASLSKNEVMRQIEETEQVAPIAGITQPELFILGSLAGSSDQELGSASAFGLQGDVERAGLTSVGFALGVRRLKKRRFIEAYTASSRDGDYDALRMTNGGWDWVEQNEDKFLLRRDKKAQTSEEFDDDIPF